MSHWTVKYPRQVTWQRCRERSFCFLFVEHVFSLGMRTMPKRGTNFNSALCTSLFRQFWKGLYWQGECRGDPRKVESEGKLQLTAKTLLDARSICALLLWEYQPLVRWLPGPPAFCFLSYMRLIASDVFLNEWQWFLCLCCFCCLISLSL